MPDIVTTGG